MSKLQQGIGSIEVGFRVLAVVERARRPLGLKDIAERADMTASNTHRYLVSFIRSGLIVRDPGTALYGLGPYALRLGLAAMARLDLAQEAMAGLHELQANFDVSTFASIWTDLGPTMIYWLDASDPISVNVKPGSRAPLLNSASGRVFLAYKPWNSIRSLVESEIRSRIDRGDTSVRGMEDVKAMIAKVRSNGLGWVHSERVPGVNGLSVPVFDAFDNVVLTITVVGLSGSLDDSFSGPLANYLRELGRQVSIRLGYSEKTADSMV